MPKHLIFTISSILATLSILLITACKKCADPVDSNETEYSVYGIIRNSNGTPIKNALIQIQYEIPYGYIETKINIALVTYMFGFTLYKKDHVLLWVSDVCSCDTIMILANDSLQTGRYMIGWTGETKDSIQVINGFYYFNLKTSDQDSVAKFLKNNGYSGYDDLNKLEYYAITDDSGSYEIPYAKLAINEQTLQNHEITNRIQLWALHSEYNAVHSEFTELIQSHNTGINLIFGK
jgi:hypothetical protein